MAEARGRVCGRAGGGAGVWPQGRAVGGATSCFRDRRTKLGSSSRTGCLLPRARLMFRGHSCPTRTEKRPLSPPPSGAYLVSAGPMAVECPEQRHGLVEILLVGKAAGTGQRRGVVCKMVAEGWVCARRATCCHMSVAACPWGTGHAFRHGHGPSALALYDRRPRLPSPPAWQTGPTLPIPRPLPAYASSPQPQPPAPHQLSWLVFR